MGPEKGVRRLSDSTIWDLNQQGFRRLRDLADTRFSLKLAAGCVFEALWNLRCVRLDRTPAAGIMDDESRNHGLRKILCFKFIIWPVLRRSRSIRALLFSVQGCIFLNYGCTRLNTFCPRAYTLARSIYLHTDYEVIRRFLPREQEYCL